jgi:predicted ribosome quality control (RQC) complex YloA/Tae2 family protein
MANSGAGYKTFWVDDFEVLVGKGDRDNDELTFRIAEPQDFWLHVAGTPGSHVVVRNPDALAELPKEVVTRAAELAVQHSKSRGAGGKVPVHLCRVAEVSKPRRAPAGQVQLARWEVVKVYPRRATATRPTSASTTADAPAAGRRDPSDGGPPRSPSR